LDPQTLEEMETGPILEAWDVLNPTTEKDLRVRKRLVLPFSTTFTMTELTGTTSHVIISNRLSVKVDEAEKILYDSVFQDSIIPSYIVYYVLLNLRKFYFVIIKWSFYT